MRYRLLRVICGALAGFGFAAGVMADPGAPGLQIKAAWIRWLPGDLPAGGYLTLVNAGDAALSLVGASSSEYAGVSLHRSVSHNGASQMVPVDRIVIPGHSTLDFAATGYHFMLVKSHRPLKPGDQVAMTLHFTGGATTVVQFEVRKPDATGAEHAGNEAMHGMSGMPGMPGM